MSIKETLAANAAPFLQPGETIDEVFRAGKRVKATTVRDFVIAGTQESVLVLRAGMWSSKKPKSLVRRVPRSTPMTFEKGRLTIGDDWFDVSPLAGARDEAARLVAASTGTPPEAPDGL